MSDVSIDTTTSISVDMAPAPAGPRILRREAWVTLPDAYAGFTFRLWVNAPQRLWNDLGSGDEARARAAMGQIVLEHNGWLDFDGQPYPPASNPEALWDAVPTELAGVVITAAQLEIAKLPNSMAPQKRRSGRS